MFGGLVHHCMGVLLYYAEGMEESLRELDQ
jgi:hypothetical protein